MLLFFLYCFFVLFSQILLTKYGKNHIWNNGEELSETETLCTLLPIVNVIVCVTYLIKNKGKIKLQKLFSNKFFYKMRKVIYNEKY